ncbi:hypothetical protein [Anaerospora sp.]|uniref:hypothetical protein n=1 Tax=Anaerospora sp. TaxID=1960278 RepID=UPI00289777B4|nr:hypothetical protein [Anaerospora sp.]
MNMSYYFEWRAEKDIQILPGNYFESTLLLPGDIDSLECLEAFPFACIVEAGKLLAATEGSIASSGQEVSFRIDTNIFLDPGLLAASLRLDIYKESQVILSIPLSVPSVRIDWPERGIFIVTVLSI